MFNEWTSAKPSRLASTAFNTDSYSQGKVLLTQLV